MSDDDEGRENKSSNGDSSEVSSEPEEISFRSPALGLSPQLISNLELRGLTIPTDIQLQVIPKIWNERGRDLCVNSPTGSGKTLAYVLPIVEAILALHKAYKQALSKRLYTALGCVVVVPTRELVQQVREVFDMCARKMRLKVEVAHGQRNFIEEQGKLVRPGPVALGGNMLTDILIATPGRLAEHILQTPGFTLQHLKFLVLDEADRLLHQSFQNWIELVTQEILSPKVLNCPFRVEDFIRQRDEIPIIGQRHVDKLFGTKGRQTISVRKFIFSATLTYDIGQLTSLQMQSPEIVSISSSATAALSPEKRADDDNAVFTLPTTLHEYVVRTTDNKPLHLLHILDKYSLQNHTLIFTNSTETANRLNHLLAKFYKSTNPDVTTAVVSSEVPGKTRKKLLSSFTAGKLSIVITTDLLSRGMDIKSIKHVISYDSPPTARVYVHRAGRTARAGQKGDVWTMVTNREARWFWKSVAAGINRTSKIERIEFKEEDISQGIKDIYHSIVVT